MNQLKVTDFCAYEKGNNRSKPFLVYVVYAENALSNMDHSILS